MIQRICDFCEKENPDYTIKCRITFRKIMPNLGWQKVDICEECYNKLFPEVEIIENKKC